MSGPARRFQFELVTQVSGKLALTELLFWTLISTIWLKYTSKIQLRERITLPLFQIFSRGLLSLSVITIPSISPILSYSDSSCLRPAQFPTSQIIRYPEFDFTDDRSIQTALFPLAITFPINLNHQNPLIRSRRPQSYSDSIFPIIHHPH